MKALLIAFVLCVLPSVASAQIMEMNGTWKLNAERTIGPSPTEETLVYRIKPGEQAYSMDALDAKGNRLKSEWVAKYDGNDQPSSTPGATVALKRLDTHTELVTNKRDGKVTSTFTRVLVDDGKTIMSVGRDANNKVIWVRVFEKQ